MLLRMLGFVDHETVGDRVLDDYRAAWQRVADHVRATADPQAAFELADRFFELERDLRPDTAMLRVEMVRRIQKAEELSLSVLAERTGLSRSRLAQMVPGPSTPPQEGDRS